MKYFSSLSALICFIALAATSVANASPTYIEFCYPTKDEAEKQHSYYAERKIDNSEAIKKDKAAMKYAYRDDILLSDMQKILGEGSKQFDEELHQVSFEWTVSIIGSPSATSINFTPSKGYCLEARRGGYGQITYEWKQDIYDKTLGSVTRYEFYY